MISSDFILGNSSCDTLNDRSVALKMKIKVIGDGKLQQYYLFRIINGVVCLNTN